MRQQQCRWREGAAALFFSVCTRGRVAHGRGGLHFDGTRENRRVDLQTEKVVGDTPVEMVEDWHEQLPVVGGVDEPVLFVGRRQVGGALRRRPPRLLDDMIDEARRSRIVD